MRSLGRVGIGTIKRRPQTQPRGAGMAPTATVSIPPRLGPVLTTAVSPAISGDLLQWAAALSRGHVATSATAHRPSV